MNSEFYKSNAMDPPSIPCTGLLNGSGDWAVRGLCHAQNGKHDCELTLPSCFWQKQNFPTLPNASLSVVRACHSFLLVFFKVCI